MCKSADPLKLMAESVDPLKKSTEGRCLLMKDIFSPVCDYAGNVDVNKSY